jgi:hypothetical protein
MHRVRRPYFNDDPFRNYISVSHNVEPDISEAIKLGMRWKWQLGLSNELRLILKQ